MSPSCLLQICLPLCLLSACLAPLAALDLTDFNLPAQDAEGWTTLSPSADSRIIYVHASGGNDATGMVYTATDAAVGSDPTQPVGTIQAFATIAAAKAHLRKGWPDWILLARGETWQENLDLGSRPIGRSPAERLVASAYGPLSAIQ